MFIAHLPTGYLLGHSLRSVLNWRSRLCLLIGSIFPDFDLLLFYFRDAQAIHHHTYLTHRPLIWAAVLSIGLFVSRKHPSGVILSALALGGMLHMVLDSLTGAIDWGWPLFEFAAPLVVVSATHSHWILSFLFHWTLSIELVICAVACFVWSTTRIQKTPANDRGSSIS